MAGIAPGRPAGAISRARLDRLVDSIRAVLEAAVEAGGSSLRDYARPDGQLGYFSRQWRVYGREGKACHCGSTIRRRTDSGRSTFYCPRCQR
jgi:formamidopyrimidine-DNA glycosylase